MLKCKFYGVKLSACNDVECINKMFNFMIINRYGITR